MDTSGANVRSVVVGLLLAALVAGSLVAFSLLAGSADDPTARRVLATRPDLDVPPVVVEEEPAVLGITVKPQQTAAPIVVSPPLGDAPTDSVLGIQLRNPKAGKRDGNGKDKGKDRDKGNPGTPGGSDAAKGSPTAHTPTCPCGDSTKAKAKNKDNTPNGHAYGYYKKPGDSGLARGHDKSNGSSNGHDKSNGSSNGHDKSNGNAKGHAKRSK